MHVQQKKTIMKNNNGMPFDEVEFYGEEIDAFTKTIMTLFVIGFVVGLVYANVNGLTIY